MVDLVSKTNRLDFGTDFQIMSSGFWIRIPMRISPWAEYLGKVIDGFEIM